MVDQNFLLFLLLHIFLLLQFLVTGGLGKQTVLGRQELFQFHEVHVSLCVFFLLVVHGLFFSNEVVEDALEQHPGSHVLVLDVVQLVLIILQKFLILAFDNLLDLLIQLPPQFLFLLFLLSERLVVLDILVSFFLLGEAFLAFLVLLVQFLLPLGAFKNLLF